MPAERYYIDSELSEGASLQLEAQEFHHLAHVMRCKVNDSIEVVNGRGSLAAATVQEITKRHASILIKGVSTQAKPSVEMILAQGIPRANRLETIIEKGTELGMTQLWLLPTQLSERKKLNENQCKRLESIAIAAMKQCGRLHLPMIQLVKPLTDWHEQPFPILFGDLSPDAPLLPEAVEKPSLSNGAIVVIGPESGLTKEETSQLHQLHATGIRLHHNILRTDTAAIVSLAHLSLLSLSQSSS